VISSSGELVSKIESVVARCRHDPPVLHKLHHLQQAIDFLNLEMPELTLVQLPDPDLGGFTLLDSILSDPWLIHGGIVALCADDDAVDRLEEMRGANLVVILSVDNLERQLPPVLDIIQDNRRILFQREIGTDLLRDISGCFQLNNDPVEARCYTNLICNFLYNANRIDAETKDSLNLALYEMLVNAIEHGNCGIGYKEKTDWLREHSSIVELVERKMREPAVARRKVTFEYTITPASSTFFIADEGEGFDWRGQQSAAGPSNLLDAHGCSGRGEPEQAARIRVRRSLSSVAPCGLSRCLRATPRATKKKGRELCASPPLVIRRLIVRARPLDPITPWWRVRYSGRPGGRCLPPGGRNPADLQPCA
jgi:hypothetical protein